MGAYKRKGNGLRSAVDVSKCSHNVTGALLGCRFHNPKVGSSILPPATNFFSRIKYLDAIGNLEKKLKSHFCCKLFLLQAFRANRILEKPQHFYIVSAIRMYLGVTTPRSRVKTSYEPEC